MSALENGEDFRADRVGVVVVGVFIGIVAARTAGAVAVDGRGTGGAVELGLCVVGDLDVGCVVFLAAAFVGSDDRLSVDFFIGVTGAS